MNGQGMRQESKPVLPLNILNQAGFLEVVAKRGQLIPVGGEVSGMLQKSSVDDMMIDIDKVLGGNGAASAAKYPDSSESSPKTSPSRLPSELNKEIQSKIKVKSKIKVRRKRKGKAPEHYTKQEN